jgi:hypothetical protein
MIENFTQNTSKVFDAQRPWPFSRGELTAGLRRKTGDPNLTISSIEEIEIPHRRPAIGRIRGVHVVCAGRTGAHNFDLLVKEPQGSTRTGAAGAGLRETAFYLNLVDHLPVRTPNLISANPTGAWLVLEQLSKGRRSENWQSADYLLAIDQLVALHDRFWGLGEDLTVYRWLRRPLDSDFNIHIQAAQTGARKLEMLDPPTLLSRDSSLNKLISTLLNHADTISKALLEEPHTLLHGDYWPGNIHIHSDSTITVYDWEETAIGPAILDVITFIQNSHWWFEPLPMPLGVLTDHYRTGLERSNNYTWLEDSWEAIWDYGLMWVFIAKWIDLLADIPDSVLESRLPQFETVWLHPVQDAIHRHFPEK